MKDPQTAPHKGANRVEVLSLYQRHLALTVALAVKMVARKPTAAYGLCLLHRLQGAAPFRAKTDPFPLFLGFVGVPNSCATSLSGLSVVISGSPSSYMIA